MALPVPSNTNGWLNVRSADPEDSNAPSKWDEAPFQPEDMGATVRALTAARASHSKNFHAAPCIMSGGAVTENAGTDTCAITATVALDENGLEIVADAKDPLTLTNTGGGVNYVVIRHKYIFGTVRASATGDWNSRWVEGWEYLCRDGWGNVVSGDVVLAKAKKSGGTWTYSVGDDWDGHPGREGTDYSGEGGYVASKPENIAVDTGYMDDLFVGAGGAVRPHQPQMTYIDLDWDAVTNADEIRVFAVQLDDVPGSGSPVAETTAAVAIVPGDAEGARVLVGAPPGVSYRLWAVGYNEYGAGVSSDTIETITGIGTDSQLAMAGGGSLTAYTHHLVATCNPVVGALYYQATWKAGSTPTWDTDPTAELPNSGSAPQFHIPIPPSDLATTPTWHVKLRAVDYAGRPTSDEISLNDTQVRSYLTTADERALMTNIDAKAIAQVADVNAVREGLDTGYVPNILEDTGYVTFSESISSGSGSRTKTLFTFVAEKKMSLRQLQVRITSPVSYSGSGSFSPANESISVYSSVGAPPAGDEIDVPIDDVVAVYRGASLRADADATVINPGNTITVRFNYSGPLSAFTLAGTFIVYYLAE